MRIFKRRTTNRDLANVDEAQAICKTTHLIEPQCTLKLNLPDQINTAERTNQSVGPTELNNKEITVAKRNRRRTRQAKRRQTHKRSVTRRKVTFRSKRTTGLAKLRRQRRRTNF